MANEHFVEMPKAVWVIKIVQLVFSVLVLALSAYCVSLAPVSASDLALFTALFSILILTYYFVALHAVAQAYNWVALLVLEILAVIFWLSSFSVLAWWYAVLVDFENTVFYYYKRDESAFARRETIQETENSYTGSLIASLTFSVIQFILYCVTLVFMSIAIHRHRTAGNPMVAGMAPSAPRAQETEMKESPVNPAPTQQQQQAYYGPPSAQPSHQAQPSYQAQQPYYQAQPVQQPTEMPHTPSTNQYEGV